MHRNYNVSEINEIHVIKNEILLIYKIFVANNIDNNTIENVEFPIFRVFQRRR